MTDDRVIAGMNDWLTKGLRDMAAAGFPVGAPADRTQHGRFKLTEVPIGQASDPGVFRAVLIGPYAVTMWREAAGVIRLSVARQGASHTPGGTTPSRAISWDDLQEVKRVAGYGDKDAVEVYPPDADVVNVADLRHLWVLPYRLPFVWR